MFMRSSQAPRLMVERLEGRDVPAANVVLQGQTLVITGDGAADTVFVSEGGDQIQVIANGQSQAPIARSAVQMISFNGNAGSDIFVNTSSVFAVALGRSGSDVLIGGSAGNVLIGGTGRDVLIGGAGADFLIGDQGNDVVFGGTGADVIVGGAGRDQYLDVDDDDAFDDRGVDLFDAPDDSDGRPDQSGRGGGNGSDD